MQLFLTLAGVTLLFTQAQLNGTLDRVAHAAVRICRGNAGLIPVMFFALACLIASVGPGNVATAAMMAPMAMAVGGRAGIPPFLMAIMVGNGAQAGALSPFAPTGIIVTGLMMKIGLGGHELRTYLANLRRARARGVRRLLPVRRLAAVQRPRLARRGRSGRHGGIHGGARRHAGGGGLAC